MTGRFQEFLATKAVLLADGAMGSSLIARGLSPRDAPELWNLSRPDEIREIHRQFIGAGADIILTNSFGANACRLGPQGRGDKVGGLNIAAARIARSAADAAGREVLVAGSIGPLGTAVAESGLPTPAAAFVAFKSQAAALKQGGVDLLWIETLSGRAELRAALAAAADCALPAIATLSFHSGQKGKDTLCPADLPAFLRALGAPPLAWGSNCGDGPREVLHHLRDFGGQARASDIIAVKANCGLPIREGDALRYPATPAVMAAYARLAADLGARIIGGCCGTTPAHLQAMAAALEAYEPKPAPTATEIDDIFARVGSG